MKTEWAGWEPFPTSRTTWSKALGSVCGRRERHIAHPSLREMGVDWVYPIAHLLGRAGLTESDIWRITSWAWELGWVKKEMPSCLTGAACAASHSHHREHLRLALRCPTSQLRSAGCPFQISLMLTAAILCGFSETHNPFSGGLDTLFRTSRGESERWVFCPCGLVDFFPGFGKHGWWHRSKTPEFTVNSK